MAIQPGFLCQIWLETQKTDFFLEISDVFVVSVNLFLIISLESATWKISVQVKCIYPC